MGIEGRTHEGMGLLLAAGIEKRRSHWGVAEKNPTPTCLAAALRQGPLLWERMARPLTFYTSISIAAATSDRRMAMVFT
jgi:hypothetical protein